MNLESSTPRPASPRSDQDCARGRGGGPLPLLLVLLLVLPTPVALGAADSAGAAEQSLSLAVSADDAMAQVAPALSQIINLALLDPQLASTMVPDEWLDTGIESARTVAHEEPRARIGADPQMTWPVGPWTTAGDLEQSIRTLDPAAAAALYGALKPRIAERCQAKGATFVRCEQEIRMSLERLSAPVVTARVAGRDDTPITDTQLEFARMGAQVVSAGKAKIEAVRRAVWPLQR
jgi:hypothetical protein